MLCSNSFSTNYTNDQMIKVYKTIKKAYSQQDALFTNVDKIDDGAVYFIRNAANNICKF